MFLLLRGVPSQVQAVDEDRGKRGNLSSGTQTFVETVLQSVFGLKGCGKSHRLYSNSTGPASAPTHRPKSAKALEPILATTRGRRSCNSQAVVAPRPGRLGQLLSASGWALVTFRVRALDLAFFFL